MRIFNKTRSALIFALGMWAFTGLYTQAQAQSVVRPCYEVPGLPCQTTSVATPFPVTGSVTATITFPTIGAAVPLTGIYNGLNVAGTLRGLAGLSTGSIFPAAVAIVDASGNQITSFGSSSVTVLASENHIGEVGGNILPITNAMTTSNNAITTGESLGGLQTLTNAVRVSGALGAGGTSGMIQAVEVTFSDAIGSGPLDVYFFNANPTGSTCTDNTTFSLVAADRDKVIGIAHVTDFTSSGTPVIAQAQNQAMPFGVASATSIFACVVSRGSITPAGTSNASLLTRILRN